jgi:hypothetical protein
MHRKIVSVVVLSTLLALIFIGNTGNVAKSAGNSNPAALPAPAQTDMAGVENSDERLAAIAGQVPGFGGMFYGQDGTLQVYMVEQQGPVSEAMTAFLEDVIAREVGRGERLAHNGIEILKGKYDFQELHSWHKQMSPEVLSLPGTVFTDIDERTNRLRIGVTDSRRMRKAVEEHLSNLGVPSEAVEIVETEEVKQVLRSRRRPLRGGLQINFGNFLCTLGVVADRGGVRGFVTNSHCTNIQGGVEGTDYHQPSASGTTNRVGEEIADPTYFTDEFPTGGSCPDGRQCRYSDSSFARVPHPSGPSVTTARGSIARPAVNSFTWNGVDTFTITAEATPVPGQTVTKVGRTTGRTTGPIQQTCANVNVGGTNITLLCQSWAAFNPLPQGGDSGSPVFLITTLPNVTLVGILWGTGSAGFFSPITGVQRAGELGAITTCASGSC